MDLSFKLNKQFVESYRNLPEPFGFNGLGAVTFYRTYSRVKEDGTQESWADACERVINGMYSIQKDYCLQHSIPWSDTKGLESAEEAFDRLFNLKWTPPGRGLWTMGSPTIHERGLVEAANNCAFVSTGNIATEKGNVFSWFMNMLMLGVGVGFDTKGAGELYIRKPNPNSKTIIIIPDTREGWADSVKFLFQSYLGDATIDVTVEFDYSKIRPAGSPIRGFGGTASGADPLIKLHERMRKILDANSGSVLSSRSMVDIFNCIGACVVSGNVRRSSEIAIGSYKDAEFVNLKNYELHPERQEWGWASNNSISASLGIDYNEYSKLVHSNGEPGFIWMQNVNKYGRMNGTEDYGDLYALGFNPCSEQPLQSYEMCTLCEIYPDKHVDIYDFLRTIKFAYLYGKTITLLSDKITHERTRHVMTKNRRIGLSITGIAQFITNRSINELINWLEIGYEYVAHYDKRYSSWLQINESNRKTTIKPSGCRPWNALTTTDQGILTLEDLFSDHPSSEQWSNFNNNVKVWQDDGWHNITKTYNNGKSPTKVIKLTYGLELTSTPNHQWYVTQRYSIDSGRNRYEDVHAWVRAEDLQPGDILDITPNLYTKSTESEFKSIHSLAIKMRNDSTEIKQPEFTNPDIGWLLGYLWGDGAMSPEKFRIRFTDARIENLRKAQHILKTYFDVDSNIFDKKDNAAYVLEISSKMLWHWLIKNGVWKYFADEIDLIPLVIRQASKETIIAFIAGLLDADGCVAATNSCNKLVISTAHDLFADHLQHVAMSVGIVLGRSLNRNGDSFQSRRHMWNLTSTQYCNSESFKLLIKHSNKCKNPAQSKAWQYEIDFKNTMTFGRIKEVVDGKEIDTYDIEVEGGHYYYAGAAKSHNTVSLLAGATPGIHYPRSEYYIRRIRISELSGMVDILRRANIHIESDLYSDNTVVASFPVHISGNIRSVLDLTIWEQLALAALMQKHWSDNGVSVTVSFDPDKTPPEEIAHALDIYQYQLKAVSLLPEPKGGAYAQMPYEEIDKETYEKMVAEIDMNILSNLGQAMTEQLNDKIDDKFCSTDSCELKFEISNLKEK